MKLTSFDCIKRVLVTSKSKKLAKNYGQIVLVIDSRANKSMVKKAAEELWENVTVKKVATMTVPGRTKRLKKGLSVVVGGYKKAIITVSNASALGMAADSVMDEDKN
jgi:ribosomal protein L23